MKVPNRCLQIVFTKIGSPQLRVGPIPNLKKNILSSVAIFSSRKFTTTCVDVKKMKKEQLKPPKRAYVGC